MIDCTLKAFIFLASKDAQICIFTPCKNIQAVFNTPFAAILAIHTFCCRRKAAEPVLSALSSLGDLNCEICDQKLASRIVGPPSSRTMCCLKYFWRSRSPPQVEEYEQHPRERQRQFLVGHRHWPGGTGVDMRSAPHFRGWGLLLLRWLVGRRSRHLLRGVRGDLRKHFDGGGHRLHSQAPATPLLPPAPHLGHLWSPVHHERRPFHGPASFSVWLCLVQDAIPENHLSCSWVRNDR